MGVALNFNSSTQETYGTLGVETCLAYIWGLDQSRLHDEIQSLKEENPS